MKRLSFVAITAAVGVLIAAPLGAAAADKSAKPAAKPAAQQVAALSADQLSTADRVLVGQSRCEFDQSVNVVHGALRHYDLPDLATMLGPDRLKIVEPVDAMNQLVTP